MAEKVEIVITHAATKMYECYASIYINGELDEHIVAKDRFELTQKIKTHLDAIVW